MAREQLDAEEQRAKGRMVELERRLAQLDRDLAREKALIDDAAGVLAKLDEENGDLEAAAESAEEVEYEAKEKLADAEGKLADSEKALADAQSALSDLNARRNALEQALAAEAQRLQRFETELTQVNGELSALRENAGSDEEFFALGERLSDAEAAVEEAERAALEAEDRHVQLREQDSQARQQFADADRVAQRLETEVRTLSKLLATAESDLWPPVVEEISVEKGYEAALGAALGDDLDASTNTSAPAHWALVGDPSNDPALPPGVQSLATLVVAPPALARRLSQIGIVVRGDGGNLQKLLKPGQRLVSKEGDLWRWDGFAAAAEAPTPAARRLVEKNRLGELNLQAEAARTHADQFRASADAVQTQLRNIAMAETQARNDARAAARALTEAHEELAAAERRRAQVSSRISALEEAASRLAQSRDEASSKNEEATLALTTLAPTAQLTSKLERARASTGNARAEAAEARAAVQGILREAQNRQARRAAISTERESWDQRRNRANSQISEISDRIDEAREEQEQLAEAPEQFLEKRRSLMDEVEKAEQARKDAADKRAEAENRLLEADRIARMSLDAMSAVREEKARSEARVEGLRQRREDIVKTIQSDLECEPQALAELAGVSPADDLPDVGVVERKLEALKQDRERLGAVNLRADDELTDVETKRDALAAEREDLTEAIRKLRLAIQSLNKEGRERLLAAFEVVNGHFKELFTTLFGGGAAELQLVESDDPLEAGLEILARPPGKKPTTMTLLSGGEQALTAMSLIFAVFLTNPSPICVLDEVDAPLDDANVERFCDLLEEMRKKTDTRFVTITHNPITMARMDRLFGVTQAERGVSQLVSVDLQQAEVLIAAE